MCIITCCLQAPVSARPGQQPKVMVQAPPGVPRSSLSKKRKAAQMETAASRGMLPPAQPLQQPQAPGFDFLGRCSIPSPACWIIDIAEWSHFLSNPRRGIALQQVCSCLRADFGPARHKRRCRVKSSDSSHLYVNAAGASGRGSRWLRLGRTGSSCRRRSTRGAADSAHRGRRRSPLGSSGQADRYRTPRCRHRTPRAAAQPASRRRSAFMLGVVTEDFCILTSSRAFEISLVGFGRGHGLSSTTKPLQPMWRSQPSQCASRRR